MRLDMSREASHDHPAAVATQTRYSSLAREKFVWLDQVRADAELTPLAFMLAYVLANLVNDRKGYAWPSVARLAADTRYTKHAATWLNKGCWSDPPITPRVLPEERLSMNVHTNASIRAWMCGDDDYDEVLKRVQEKRNKRG